MKLLTTCIVLLIVTQPILTYAQKIELHGIAPGAHSEVTNAGKTLKLSGTFGQPITNSDDSKLSSGFFASTTSVLSENSPPTIANQTNGTSFDFSVGPTLIVKFSDPDGIESAAVFFKTIGSTGIFTSTPLSPTGSDDKFDFTSSFSGTTNDFDNIGMEYYIEATDETGLTTRLPSEGSLFTYAIKGSVSFPNSLIEPGSEVTDYRIISLPYQIGGNDIATLFSGLGGGDKSKWRLFSYDGDDSFSEFPNGSARTFVAGKSYWVLISEKTATELVLGSDISTPQNNQNNLFEMTLQPGWNMVGNPYPETISWEDVKNYNSNNDIGTIKIFNGDYANSDDLLPFQGGLAFLEGSTAVAIEVPFKGQTVPTSRTARLQEKPFTNNIADNNWLLNFKIQQGNRTNTLGGIGMHMQAHNDKDRFDELNPPRFLSFLELNSPHPTHILGNFSRDIVPTSSQHRWQFTINSSTDEPLTISWDNSNFASSTTELYLFDVEHQQIIDMRTINEVAVNNNATIEIYYGNQVLERMGPEIPFLGTPYPNPVNTTLASAIFPLRLSGQNDYQVEAVIFSMEGRMIKTLHNGSLHPGLHTLDWNGTSSMQVHTESGMYIYRINISSSAGQWQFTGKLIIAN